MNKDSDTHTRLVIARGHEKALQRQHPWVFSGAIHHIEGEKPAEGDIVDVVNSDGKWLASGMWQNDTIACKIVSYHTSQIDNEFWRNRLKNAIDYRQRMGFFDNAHTNVFRLVNGEGDYMPGLVADYYGGVVVLQAHSVGMHRLFGTFCTLLQELLDERLSSVFDKSAATLPDAYASADRYLWGIEPDTWEIKEHDNRMLINFYEGQKTGFFVDQRENRIMLQQLSRGQRVMNCFGYTGGFSLAALRGGASYVETVDVSRKAIDLCNQNVQMNFGSEAVHRGVVADVMQYLESDGDHFDIIILDPPAFAKNHYALQRGLKGYRSINTKALQRLHSGGLLLTFSCSQAVSVDDFRTMAFSSAALAGKEVRVVRTLPHAFDHPVSIYHPEGEYLKGLILEVV